MRVLTIVNYLFSWFSVVVFQCKLFRLCQRKWIAWIIKRKRGKLQSDTFTEKGVFLSQGVLPNEPGRFTWTGATHSLWETIREVPEHLGRVQLQSGNIAFSTFTVCY